MNWKKSYKNKHSEQQVSLFLPMTKHTGSPVDQASPYSPQAAPRESQKFPFLHGSLKQLISTVTPDIKMEKLLFA